MYHYCRTKPHLILFLSVFVCLSEASLNVCVFAVYCRSLYSVCLVSCLSFQLFLCHYCQSSDHIGATLLVISRMLNLLVYCEPSHAWYCKNWMWKYTVSVAESIEQNIIVPWSHIGSTNLLLNIDYTYILSNEVRGNVLLQNLALLALWFPKANTCMLIYMLNRVYRSIFQVHLGLVPSYAKRCNFLLYPKL